MGVSSHQLASANNLFGSEDKCLGNNNNYYIPLQFLTDAKTLVFVVEKRLLL